MKLLLCSSSSYKDTGYLTHTEDTMRQFISRIEPSITQALFIPYAGVTNSYDQYLQRVTPHFAGLGIDLLGLHQVDDPRQALADAQLIIVGGGNTFALLSRLQQQGLLEVIREQVAAGTPYIGWSAGSNLAGMRISTTNDMPIVEPQDFNALGLVPFLINPHFISGQIAGHNGESREQRLAEFMIMNPTDSVVAIHEGSALIRDGDTLSLVGDDDGYLFLGGEQSSIARGRCDALLGAK